MSIFVGPVEVQLAKAQDQIPTASAMSGGTRWEIKLDGFRAPIRVTDQGVELWSRRGSELGSSFPDIVAAAAAQVGAGTVLDGELVAWAEGRLSFDHLLQRMVASPAVLARMTREHPAYYVAFDLLALGGEDWRPRPWRERREALEGLAVNWRPPLELCPSTDDFDIATQWFVDYRAVGVEGLVAKGAAQPYRPGTRSWIKVRARENVDVIVGAVVGPIDRPTAIVAGRYTEGGVLQMVGRSAPLTRDQSGQLAAVLAPADDHPWPVRIGSGGFGGGPVEIIRVRPDVVVEVAADGALMGGRYRHSLRLIRVRVDLSPADVPYQ